MNVLMLSSSKVADGEYLAEAGVLIDDFLEANQKILFIPYAGVSTHWDVYIAKVQKALPHLDLTSIHQFSNPKEAIQDADALLVGGGNTFNLLYHLQDKGLLETIQSEVASGMPYIGWSAGSNICGLSIKTTNDMPIIQPENFDALGLIPCQLNPHFSDFHPKGFHGETRSQRISEFCTLWPDIPVVCIPEGCAVQLTGNRLSYVGAISGKVFKGEQVETIDSKSDLAYLL